MPPKIKQQGNTSTVPKKAGKAKQSEPANRLNAEMDEEAKKEEVDRQEASSYYSCVWRKSL